MTREEEVKKAVSFLEHPQVKPTAGQRKVDFLRKKGLTDEEIKEAFQRAGQIYPEDSFSGNVEGEKWNSPPKATATPDNLPKTAVPNESVSNQQAAPASTGKVYSNSVPSNPTTVTQPGGIWVPQPFAYVTPQVGVSQQPQQKSSSWSFSNVFLGAGAAAGIVLAIREILRKYVVPLYFPEARQRDSNKAKVSHGEDYEERHYMEKQFDELKTLMKNLVKATDRNNDMMEELIHNSQRKTREELNEVVTCLKSVVSGLQALKDIRTSEAIHSEENGRRQDNVVILKGSQKEQDERDFSKSESQTWQPNRNWLVGEDNYSLDASGIGTQIFSNKMKDPGMMDDFMSIPPASLEELVPKTKNISSTVDQVQNHSNQKDRSFTVNNENMMPNGTLDEENAKKAFQQAMLAEARAALERKGHPSSLSSPVRSIDSDRQITDKDSHRDSDNIAVDATT
ncbi:hypothetical protein GAYE_PCTG14G0642 [Galdieria yellowstonensis]|uniref:Peroxisomal membrane protein PEX14 n=1 Tax=Galdieria yellowstonensis TaxID=3028027 RepID=A0AAV9I3R5_9RHOD|nr:hypothetical protein GAYE_PCTG14G0642 [Galdieria yellowstonensis]